MVDLSKSGCQEFWKEKHPQLAEVIAAMDEIEGTIGWTHDNAESVEFALGSLAAKLGHGITRHGAEGSLEQLVYALAYIRTSRAMRIINHIDGQFEDYGTEILRTARDLVTEGNLGWARIMLERVSLLKRMRHMARVFSRSRVSLLMLVLEGKY